MLIGKRALIRLAAAGVAVSALATASTFTTDAREFTFLRYPLLGSAIALLILAGWSPAPLPAFNRTLWAHAPWWARLAWLAILAAALATFATISLSDATPADSAHPGGPANRGSQGNPGNSAGSVDPAERAVLETRGVGAVAAYLFLIAGLRSNVGENAGKGEASTWNSAG